MQQQLNEPVESERSPWAVPPAERLEAFITSRAQVFALQREHGGREFPSTPLALAVQLILATLQDASKAALEDFHQK